MNGRPDFREALKLWLRIGFISFGGPAGQIAILHKEVVERRRWIDDARFTSGLSFCTFLPGPEAQQLATYIGWRLHGYRGGIAAGVLFFLPAVALLLVLSFIRAEYGNLPVMAAVLWGLRATIVAILADAVLGMSKRRIVSPGDVALAGFAFITSFFLRIAFPFLVIGAGLLGLMASRIGAPPSSGALPAPTPQPPIERGGGIPRFASIVGFGVLLWSLPWLWLIPAGETAALFRQQYVFFTQSALVTFGGAYAVLSYVTQAAVDQFHWLSRPEVIDGLALAETTPGPLIIVLQYVGFLAAWNDPHGLPRGLAGTLGALLTTYATFLPSLVLVLAGAPFVERLAAMPRVGGALSAISAAVTGVIASLALDYGVAVALPGTSNADWDVAALLLVTAGFLALRRKAGLGLPQAADKGWIGVYDAYSEGSRGILLYLGDKDAANSQRRAVSVDNGQSFTFDQSDVLHDSVLGGGGNSYVDPKTIKLPDGRRRLFVMRRGEEVLSFISTDGLTYTLEAGKRIVLSDLAFISIRSLNDPVAVRLVDGRYRMYVAALVNSTNEFSIVSATTK